MTPLVLTQADPAYPQRFLELARPPELVFVSGHLELLNRSPVVAIVGSRRSSEQGREMARNVARTLAEAGVTIASGGALGIDGEAHAGAVDAGRGTIVVLPSPVARPLPRCHAPLFEAVLRSGGVLLSETENEVPGKSAFCARNRLVAALADVVLVVEARASSGTQHTVRAARRLGRMIAAVPWNVTDPRGAGCVDLLRMGARAVVSPDDILRALGLRTREKKTSVEALSASPTAPLPDRDPGAGVAPMEIWRLLGEGLDSADVLSERLGRPVPEVLAVLTRLELGGRVRGRGGRFQRVS